MIWTDVCPLFIYLYLFLFYTNSYAYYYKNDFQKTLYLCFFSCAFISRILSSVYHIFNVISAEMQERLLIIDYIGISSAILTYPYVFATIFEINDFNNPRFLSFIIALILLESLFIKYPSFSLLMIICSIGTILTMVILLDSRASFIWKISYSASNLFMYGGILIFQLHIPECLWLNKYTTTFLYSHILWHNCVSATQLLLINASFHSYLK